MSTHLSPRRALVVLPLLAALVVALVLALGGSDAGAKGTVRLKAVEKNGLRFSKKTVRTAPGKTTFVLSSPRANKLPHALEIEGKGIEKETRTIGGGASAKVVVTLKKGTYEFYCPVGDHEAAGMRGKVVVG